MTSVAAALRPHSEALGSAHPSRVYRVLGRLVSIPALCGYLYAGLGLWLALGPGYFQGDALARTANALYVIKSRDAHVGALGFIWNPLPSIAQIPLLLVLDPLGLAYLAGPVHSVLFGVGSLVVLDLILRLLEVGRWRRSALLLIYGLHPVVVFYALNGMSEIPFFFFILAATHQYLRWARGSGAGGLLLFSLFSATTFLVRYEGLAFCAAGVIALMLTFLSGRDLEPDRLEAILLTYLAPIAYVVALWIFFNAIVVGDPLYFYRSSGSNLAQTASSSVTLGVAAQSGVVGSLTGSLGYVALRWALVMPAVIPVTLLAFIRGVFRGERVTLALLCFAAALPAFSMFLLYSGALAPWLRFYIYSIPFTVVLLPMVLEPLRAAGRAWAIGWTVSFVLLLVGVPASVYALVATDFHEESGIVGRLLVPEAFPDASTFATERTIAAYVDVQPEGTVVLMDSSFAFAVNLFARDHKRFAITSDRDFKDILDRPDSGLITHILVPDPRRGDAVGAVLPEFWQAGAAYARLEREFGGSAQWRLYRIIPAEAR